MGHLIIHGKCGKSLPVEDLTLKESRSRKGAPAVFWPVLWMVLLVIIYLPAVAQLAGKLLPAADQPALPSALKIKGDFRHFELDKLGNLFLISQGGSKITQYNKAGDSVNHYDNVSSYGAISELDATNPLKLAIYYRDYGTIVVLDRFLSPVNTIDLRNAGIWEAETIATSYDNQFWVYDKQDAKIKKINGQGKVTFASNDLRQVFEGGVDPVKLLDRDGLLYAYDPAYGWYIFDYYGALNQKIPVQGLKDIGVTEGILTAREDKAGRPYLWVLNSDPHKLGALPLEKPLLPDEGDSQDLEPRIRQSLFIGRSGELLLLTDKGLEKRALTIN